MRKGRDKIVSDLPDGQCRSSGGPLGKGEMRGMSSRWQYEHVTRQWWALVLLISEGTVPVPLFLPYKSLANSVKAFPFNNL